MNKKQIIFSLIFTMLSIPLIHAQVLETETAWPLIPGQVELGAGLEFQTSAEGTETALPLAIEFGLSKRFTALIEPVAFTTISPKIGNATTGLGDLEVTLFYNFAVEKKLTPALTLSAEVKIPTTNNILIGTGKTDFTPFIIASKHIKKFDISANLSYTFIGKPLGILEVQNLFGYSLGTVYNVSSKFILFGEIYGNTASFGTDEQDGNIETASINPEISGGETVGAIGFGYYTKNKILFSLGVSYDNNQAFLFRPGIEFKFGGKKESN